MSSRTFETSKASETSKTPETSKRSDQPVATLIARESDGKTCIVRYDPETDTTMLPEVRDDHAHFQVDTPEGLWFLEDNQPTVHMVRGTTLSKESRDALSALVRDDATQHEKMRKWKSENIQYKPWAAVGLVTTIVFCNAALYGISENDKLARELQSLKDSLKVTEPSENYFNSHTSESEADTHVSGGDTLIAVDISDNSEAESGTCSALNFAWLPDFDNVN
ncbi:hypothetical protein I302_104580 [Kwoniella bestiolae CBS 10118]|uniref:Transmembrane protein n=1 Tax=Kwoniella bestiolae CBS 10118 TaxID=1296100 RepID=A0A1B9GBP1_9TREE|nr:hypothetical protein I302_03286 [Kwoniella bestiolae CBS 10118]OCF28427.1 hypothetical protein I302_03286 [Kwoniella bestiolae CBS 10118]